jgi:hypothetical protein
MRRAIRAIGFAVVAVGVAVSLSGCITVQVNMPGSSAAAAAQVKKVTSSQARAAELEQLRASVTEAARNRAASITKRWVQLITATDTSLVADAAGHRYAAVTVKIPGMDPALFVYRRDGSAWTLLGYGVRGQAKASRPLYAVPANVWQGLLG